MGTKAKRTKLIPTPPLKYNPQPPTPTHTYPPTHVRTPAPTHTYTHTDIYTDTHPPTTTHPFIHPPPPPNIYTHTAYTAGNEPYAPWEGLDRNGPEYKKLKEERSQILWRAIEKAIPDVRARVKLSLAGTPLTHARFLRRDKVCFVSG